VTFVDESIWQSKVFSAGWPTVLADAFTETRWVTVREEIAPYPF
jgi:hypothetical protein